MIPDAQVDEVRARADLVDIIGELVPLKKAGKEFKANCPFHEERTPSFYVVPAKGFYNCFGCGQSGDVFGFVMKRLGLDFVEAVKYVAARSGVEIQEVTRGADARTRIPFVSTTRRTRSGGTSSAACCSIPKSARTRATI